MKTFTLLACTLSVCLLTGCMNQPGDGFTVHDDDWKVETQQICVCLDGSDPCESCQRRDYYLPLTFEGYTETPYETVHLEKWVPDRYQVHNAVYIQDPVEGPVVVHDNRDLIYLASHWDRWGRIPGQWERIATVRSLGTELPGGWHKWWASIEFRPCCDWEVAFAKKPDRDNKWRFDFRAVGAKGNVLYCWEQGFHNYFLSEADLLTQYAEHMAVDPGTMSIFFDRNAR